MKKKNPVVELVLCVFLGFFGVHKFYVGKKGIGILYLFTFGLGGLGWLFDIVAIAMKILKGRNATKKAANVLHAWDHPQTLDNGMELAYHYDDVKFYPPTEMVSKVNQKLLQPGTEIFLKQEPSNEYDRRAVALYVSGHQIGYLLRGRLQDMANTFISKGLPIKATLLSLDMVAGDYQGYLSISYYRESK